MVHSISMGDLAWQGDEADCRPRMPARVAEHLDEQIRAAVDYFRLVLEIRAAVHHAEDLHYPSDAIEITEGGSGCRQNLKTDFRARRRSPHRPT